MSENNISQEQKLIFNEMVGKLPLRSGVSFKIDRSAEGMRMFPPHCGDPRHIGGHGITYRDIHELESKIPTVATAIAVEQGKVAFFGNGLSSVPLLLADRYRAGALSRAPIIVDIFAYDALAADLELLAEGCEKNKLKIEDLTEKILPHAQALRGAIQERSIESVTYYFGQNSPPASLSNLDLAINCFGPPVSTIGEQLPLLGIGGVLYTNRTEFIAPWRYIKRKLKNDGLEKASKITRVF